MEPIVSYLEDTEKKVVKEMAELFSKMREQRDTMAIDCIADMYSSTPIEGVLYEPCVRIPSHLGGHYYCSEYKLPKDEYVIFIKSSTHQHMNGQSYGGTTYKCIALTNYGRCFIPTQITNGTYGGYSSHSLTNDNNYIQLGANGSMWRIKPIIKLDPLSYKIPESFIKAFNLGISVAGICDNLHPDTVDTISEATIKRISDTTSALQELNKEFYLFAGKWQPHMTKYATLDVDSMRQTIIENMQTIQDLSGKNKTLEEQNASLQAEITLLKEQKTALEKEKARLLPLEKYKTVVLEFMNEHYDANKKWLSQDIEYEDEDIPMDSSIIDFFKAFHSNKVFMNEWEYDNVMESKEELQEYRIYKKVKGEMVSSGMDNSSVARNVSSIKHNVKKLNKL